MITGFNTDIENGGVVYHVQTEDKGLETPLILSLVYTGGEILAAKRTTYEDLIESGFDETILSERLQRQHRLICAAIKQGRIEDLKRMNARDLPAKAKPQTAPPPKVTEPQTTAPPAVKPRAAEPKIVEPKIPKPLIAEVINAPKTFEQMPAEEIAVELLEIEPLSEVPVTVIDLDSTAPAVREFDFPNDAAQPPAEPQLLTAEFVRVAPVSSNALNLSLLDARDYRGGDRVKLQIHVTHNSGGATQDAINAEVMVKVLGAAFRPVILHANTNKAGIATIQLQLPTFRTGRAAILVRATFNGFEAELRRIVSQG